MKSRKLALLVCLSAICWMPKSICAETCECMCVADNTCMQHSGCSGGDETGCRSVQFTAECGGAYTLAYDLSCTGATCAKCYACVFLKDENGNMVNACHSDCASGNCDGNCTTGITLTKDKVYELFVCLRTCSDNSCENCVGGCVARGYIYKYSNDCSFGAGCAP